MSTAGKKIRIVKLDPAQSRFTDEVCDALTGCEFVCVDDQGFVPTPVASASGATIAPILCFHVDQGAVVAEVSRRSVFGGMWLAERYPQPDQVFTFYPDQVEVL